MNSTALLSLLVQQSLQVAVLACAVYAIVRTVGRERAHLAHLLWTLVLIKCLTPPIWSSPIGVFSHVPWFAIVSDSLVPREPGMDNAETISQTNSVPWTVRIDHESKPAGNARAMVSPSLANPTHAPSLESCNDALVWIWIAGFVAVVTTTGLRLALLLRKIALRRLDVPVSVQACVERLHGTLGLRAKVRVCVVDAWIGPAVISWGRPTILLPKAIVEGRSEVELEPLIAHEMVHVRRGDLWWAVVQCLACAIGWFHPLVWFASKRLTVESERCCDEETIARLRCKPIAYARGLLHVLELKHALRVAPALPGVRPVDITASRLERIMRLGKGSHRHSPRWAWCAVTAFAVVVLPGANALVSAPPEQIATTVGDGGNANARVAASQETRSLQIPTASPAIDGSAEHPRLVRIATEVIEVDARVAAAKPLIEWAGAHTESRIPGLSEVPVMGKLFKGSAKGVLSPIELDAFRKQVLEPCVQSTLFCPTLIAQEESTATVQAEISTKGDSRKSMTLEFRPTRFAEDRLHVDFSLVLEAEPVKPDSPRNDGVEASSKESQTWSFDIALNHSLVLAQSPSEPNGRVRLILVRFSNPSSDAVAIEGGHAECFVTEGQVLSVRIGGLDGEPTNPWIVRVQNDEIRLPFLRAIRVTGCTLSEISTKITDEYMRVLGATSISDVVVSLAQ